MASSKRFLDYILEQLGDLQDVGYKPMMGEFILYYRGKIIGGIYDDRLLVKPVSSAVEHVANVQYALPYEGAKEMLVVDDVDDREYLKDLFMVMYDELPAPKRKDKRRNKE